jgi:translocation and assembly module TamB
VTKFAAPGFSSRSPLRKLAMGAAAMVTLLLLLLSSLSFILSTETGSQWALTRAVENLNAGELLTVEIDNTQGTIFRGLSFGRVRITSDSMVIAIQDLRTSWNPYSLLTGQLFLSDLWVSRLRLELQENDATTESEIGAVENPLPIGVTLSSLRIERLEVLQQGQLTAARSISMGAELNDTGLEITALQLSTLGAEISGDVAIGFAENLNLSGILTWQYDLLIEDRTEELIGRLQFDGDLSLVNIDHQLEAPQRIHSSGTVVSGLEEGALRFDLSHTAETAVLPIQVPGSYALSDITLTTSGNLDAISLSLQTDLQYQQYPMVRIDTEASYVESVLNFRSFDITQGGNVIGGSAMVDWSDLLSIEGSYVLRLEDVESFIDLPDSIQLANVTSSGSYDLVFPDAGVQGNLSIESLDGQLAGYPVQGQGSFSIGQSGFEVGGFQLSSENNQLSLEGSYSDTLDINWALSAGSLNEFFTDFGGALEGEGGLRGDPAAPDVNGRLLGSNLAYQQFSADSLALEFERIAGQVEGELGINTLSYSDVSIQESLSEVILVASGSEAEHRIDLQAKTRFGELLANLTGGISDLQNVSWQGELGRAAIDTAVGSWSTRGTTAISVARDEATVSEACLNQQNSTVCFSLQQTVDGGFSVSGTLQDYPLSIFNSGRTLTAGAGANLVQDQLLHLPQLPPGSTLAGTAGGEFDLVQVAEEDLQFDFRLTASDSFLQIMPEQLAAAEDFDEDAAPQQYDFEILELSGGLRSGEWLLSATTEILRENLDDSEIDARGAISADIAIAADSGLGGTIEARLTDLRWLQAVVPEFTNIEGSLIAQSELGGNLSVPEVTGSINLQDASVTIDTLGITLNNINTTIRSNESQSIQVAGGAQSDTGAIEFNGEITSPFDEAAVLSAQVIGENFQFANIPNLELTLSPNVRINIDASSIAITGSLDVPTLDLTIEQLPETAVDVSGDVIIVSYPADRPDLERSIAATEATVFDRPLTGAVDITLGDNVNFSGFGMSTKLVGNLNIQQLIGGSNRTYGELSIVEGRYEMYSQSLNISQGKLLFFGAYDNPGIDLRATREVEGFTVGVLMNGTLKNLNSQLFSTPALADNDIISVLVTGRPFSEIGQQDGDGDAVLAAIAKLGVGRSEGLTNQVRNKLGLDVLTVDPTDDINNSVLTIGKYLTPEIFIRYGVGLFDSQSKVAVDYTLSERVKLKAESGEYQSVDIIYSVAR